MRGFIDVCCRECRVGINLTSAPPGPAVTPANSASAPHSLAVPRLPKSAASDPGQREPADGAVLVLVARRAGAEARAAAF
jgi:hypothetical protein